MNQVSPLPPVLERAGYFLNPLASDITLICEGSPFQPTLLNAIEKDLLRDDTGTSHTAITNMAHPATQEAVTIRYAVCFHAKVFAQAEYFGIESLQGLAADRFSTTLRSLRRDENGFAAAMAELYDRRSWDYLRLRRRVIPEILNNQAIYRSGPGCYGKSLSSWLLEHVPGLGRDLAFTAMDEMSRLRLQLAAAEQALKTFHNGEEARAIDTVPEKVESPASPGL
ncbi:uncharacterized protein BP01DRAFT_383329 [Aspergillus saccharolyticus JOP 1030-1]|uniref:Uncharacterized protein n=1 Tax=Aspergillus saccharolyticus JOP 1030-1 TaxID=1450539 RepID=A0A318ZER1_9EURO|nr:hypothetical protein BP01DRAFT_383329 [Aspergillus saccharolyticus JOP 1030-1]PYH44764.1 hypothetical protein BP01DRAFT_383329 [Aspergillus saccharolyticus JOP 1030-1]